MTIDLHQPRHGDSLEFRDELFRDITECVCGSLSLNEGLARALPHLAQNVPIDAIQLTVIDLSTGSVRSVAWASHTQGTEVFSRHLSIKVPSELIVAAEEYGIHPAIFNRPADDRWMREQLEQLGLPLEVSLMTLRLDEFEGHRGTLALVAAGNDRFEPRHLALMESLRVPFNIALSNALRYEQAVALRDRLEEDNRALRRDLRQDTGTVIGAHQGLRRVMEMVERVAPTDSPVLLLGETGVGKEVIATALHEMSQRRQRVMIRVNCGSIPETLVSSELFGHEKGAFTGASSMRRGLFERANGSTIFLDEIAELPLAAQVKLLRVLQSMEFERVGGTETISVDVRVIAATHQSLRTMVAQGRFREDLWYRLDVFPIRIPPLRERLDDIPLLASYFMDTRAREAGLKRHPRLAEGAVEQLLGYPWPGNVRELRNVIERALILSRGEPVEFPELQSAPRESRSKPGPVLALEDAQAEFIRHALRKCDGRIKGPSGAAELLRLHPSTLRNKMIRLGIAHR